MASSPGRGKAAWGMMARLGTSVVRGMLLALWLAGAVLWASTSITAGGLIMGASVVAGTAMVAASPRLRYRRKVRVILKERNARVSRKNALEHVVSALERIIDLTPPNDIAVTHDRISSLVGQELTRLDSITASTQRDSDGDVVRRRASLRASVEEAHRRGVNDEGSAGYLEDLDDAMRSWDGALDGIADVRREANMVAIAHLQGLNPPSRLADAHRQLLEALALADEAEESRRLAMRACDEAGVVATSRRAAARSADVRTAVRAIWSEDR